MEIKTNCIINSIKENPFNDNDKDYGCSYDGFVINTNIGEIRLGISNYQQCCENWNVNSTGYILPLEIDLIKINDVEDAFDDGGAVDIDFCNIGNTLFTVRLENHHNGYYAHSVYLSIFDELIDWSTI